MDEIIADGTAETPTYEELLAQVVAKDRALEKANAKIVELKTSNKKSEEKVVEATIPDDEKIDLLIAEKLKKYFPEDKKEETDEDEQIEKNQEKTNAMSIMWDENTSGWDNKLMSVTDFDKLTPSMKRDYINKTTSQHWSVMFL